MKILNPKVDNFLDVGCGRCDKVGTPKCKVIIRNNELVKLREIVLQTELVEELKWSQPVYTLSGKNVLMVSAFNDYSFISFFKGVLLKDPAGFLKSPGANSQSDRHFRFTSVEEIVEIEELIKDYIDEAITNEKAGKKVQLRKTEDYPIPDELQEAFDEMPDFKAAFEALTPGRQRGYLLHFSSAKQSKTRTARIEKNMQKIFDGKGWNER